MDLQNKSAEREELVSYNLFLTVPLIVNLFLLKTIGSPFLFLQQRTSPLIKVKSAN